MRTIINVNRHVIAKNRMLTKRAQSGEISEDAAVAEMAPTLSVKTYKANHYTKHVLIKDGRGRVIAQIVYRPFKPLSCGATVWIEVLDSTNVEILNESQSKESGITKVSTRKASRGEGKRHSACRV
jgi:hypothetical protein